MKIIRVFVMATPKVVSITHVNHECEQTDNGYIVQTHGAYMSGFTMNVENERIMKVDSLTKEGVITPLRVAAWYLDEADMPKATKLCLDALQKEAIENFDNAGFVMEAFNQPYEINHQEEKINL